MGVLLPLISLALVALAHGLNYEDNYAQLRDEIKAKTSLWTPGYNKRFEGMSWDEIKRMMGARSGVPPGEEGEVARRWVLNADSNLPDTFDASQNWPKCADHINFIRDQSKCGSCWAVSAAAAMTDRTCIGTDGAQTPYISDEDVIECCGHAVCGDCDGGWPLQALKWWTKTGVVTGGPYDSTGDCKPYSVAPDAQSATSPSCTKQCQKGYNTAYANDKHKGSKAYFVNGGPTAMQQELFENGPIVAGFTVYEDFMSYYDGVYHHVSGRNVGGHAVKVVGWGTENNTPYWLVANSWNASWGGLGGFFKIQRGNDECGFEDDITAGLF